MSETVSERRLADMERDGRLEIGDYISIGPAEARACDHGREALKLLRQWIDDVDRVGELGVEARWEAQVTALLAQADQE